MTGLLYFIVIILANTVGAISGMGGGVIIKPVLDFIGAHSVAAISFYSTVAVFTMSIVSTARQAKSGAKLNWKIIGWLSFGAVLGGVLGNVTFEWLLNLLKNDQLVQLIQIGLTIVTLVFAFLYTKYGWVNYHLNHVLWYLSCGLILGFLASLLGIGGGPINVSLMMLMFTFPIKEATIYSICTIFFSQLAKLMTIATTTGFGRYDLTILFFVISAAIIGGLLGAKANNLLSEEKVTLVFQAVILLVLVINLYNGYKIF
ncbi:sulfite exporter TauE/SafE family protein [Amphibacillus sediminis]|uniref:sulfite exporter TauE/SafE family protein n=1 Tax=Amphibacillus sediminis TaxID=360185 RepID=UPI00082F6373|nr:sulfite exporter TauE/SafE family protein [Amphibacillus sediminis]